MKGIYPKNSRYDDIVPIWNGHDDFPFRAKNSVNFLKEKKGGFYVFENIQTQTDIKIFCRKMK
jgi:hypothetical protein